MLDPIHYIMYVRQIILAASIKKGLPHATHCALCPQCFIFI